MSVLLPLMVAACDGAPTPDGGTDSPETGTVAPILVAHRGASAYAPEHTIASYELGIEQGADYIEPDLQITSDGVLIAFHDLTLERTTNVAEVFPDRFEEVEVDGETRRVWPVNDFSWDEIQTLDAGSWFDASFADTRVPSFDEVVEVAKGRAGLFIETKAPEVYGDRGFDMEALLLNALRRAGLDTPGADPETPVIIQSFSPASLELLRVEHGTELPLALLIGGREAAEEWLSADGLARAAEFVTGIGPNKAILVEDRTIIERAHELGLDVVPWTFRANRPGDGFDGVEAEMRYFLDELGVDGIITDNPDLFPATAPRGTP
ncbi:MAG: glycerophosphodiester phosphodiesterase family protein [Gemmatimonadota bacterium]